jgi:hypothetical protein
MRKILKDKYNLWEVVMMVNDVFNVDEEVWKTIVNVLEKKDLTIVDIFEDLSIPVTVFVYDSEDDEAPLVGKSVWDFPQFVTKWKLKVFDYTLDETEDGRHILLVYAVKKDD